MHPHTMAKNRTPKGGESLLEMLAGVPQVAAENFLVFAGVPQGTFPPF